MTANRLRIVARQRARPLQLERTDQGAFQLLSALVGIAAILVWQQLVDTVGATYTAADTDVQTMAACTPDPGVTVCP